MKEEDLIIRVRVCTLRDAVQILRRTLPLLKRFSQLSDDVIRTIEGLDDLSAPGQNLQQIEAEMCEQEKSDGQLQTSERGSL